MRKWETRANLRLKPTVTDSPVALGEAERDEFLPLRVFKIPETSPNCALSRRDERERQNVAPGTGRTRHGREDAANPFPIATGCSPCSSLPESRQRPGDARQRREPLAPLLPRTPRGQRHFAAFSPELVTKLSNSHQKRRGGFAS